VSDDEVDEEGNPLVTAENSDQAQVPVEGPSAQQVIDVESVPETPASEQQQTNK
jgi:hypothetical protein